MSLENLGAGNLARSASPARFSMTAAGAGYLDVVKKVWAGYRRAVAGSRLPQLVRIVMTVNLAIILANVAAGAGRYFHLLQPGQGKWLDVVDDYSAAEIAGYFELAFAIVLMVGAFRRRRVLLVGFLAGIMAYMLADDMLEIHDHLRVMIGMWLFPADNWELQEDKGELVYVMLVLLPMLAGLAYVLAKTTFRQFVTALPVLASIGLFGFFAIGVDQLRQLLEWERVMSNTINTVSGIVEDGGELIATGFILFAAYALYRLTRASTASA